MAKEFSRTRRVADQIQRHMAELIQMELGDPRVGMVTITGVDVTHEFERARVYFTVLGSSLGEKAHPDKPAVENEQARITADVLNKAAGYLRTALARRLKLRTTPQLVFIYDSSMEHGNRLTDLINSAAASDSANSDADDSGQ
ncbi:MAG: 30S ribosome-binding factor RbfA [Gammaproteobacteria bacterium]|nr:30S ribosome-binding factor RbfA [Gammaproteobacteria bacterium]